MSSPEKEAIEHGEKESPLEHGHSSGEISGNVDATSSNEVLEPPPTDLEQEHAPKDHF